MIFKIDSKKTNAINAIQDYSKTIKMNSKNKEPKPSLKYFILTFLFWNSKKQINQSYFKLAEKPMGLLHPILISTFWPLLTILAKSLHFSFIAMKRWKFQDHCDESDECDEITKENFFDLLLFFLHFYA